MKKDKIILYSGDASLISSLKEKFNVESVRSRNELFKSRGDLIIADCDMENMKCPSLFKDIKKQNPNSRVIMISSTVGIQEAVEAARLGVSDFIKKPVSIDLLTASIKHNFFHEEYIQLRPNICLDMPWLCGNGSKLNVFIKNLETAINDKQNILFISENGININDLAKLVHKHLNSRKKMTKIDLMPFQKENAENIFWPVLQEAIADSSVIYFMNFMSFPQKTRKSIIDFIQQKSVKGHVIVIADMKDISIDEEFSEWGKISVPSLKSRKEDIVHIFEGYMRGYTDKYGKTINNISIDLITFINRYSWPGNYRELEAIIENAVLACQSATLTFRDMLVPNKMLFEALISCGKEDLLDFMGSVEDQLIDIFRQKTGSLDVTANLLDIPRTKLLENIHRQG